MKNLWLFFSLVIHMSALWWGLTALKFSFTWVRPAPGPPKYEKSIFFHILGLSLKFSYQIASLFDMYIDMDYRKAEKQDRPSVIIEHPLRAPQISQDIHILYILAHIWKTGFQIVSPCCAYVFTVMRFAFIFFIFFILTQKVLIRLLLYLTCKLLLNGGYMWTKMCPVWILKPPPPPPPRTPHLAKDVNVFTYVKLIIHCFSLLYICIQCDAVFMTL